MKKQQLPIVFGEVLYDVFADGGDVLGGAPFNVAWHLQGFGAKPLMISKVGDDDRGREILKAMDQWGMNTDGVQLDSVHSTGFVTVIEGESGPRYKIEPKKAYDFIKWTPISKLLTGIDVSLLYHGSLATRATDSEHTLTHLIQSVTMNVFMDVNLRKPWWKSERIREWMTGAMWIKLNADELKTLEPKTRLNAESLDQMRKRYNAQWLIVTRGDQGAVTSATDAEWVEIAAKSVRNEVDSVGAGDAFSAVTILGILNAWPVKTTLRRATYFAAEICKIRGAISDDPALYKRCLSKWEKED